MVGRECGGERVWWEGSEVRRKCGGEGVRWSGSVLVG